MGKDKDKTPTVATAKSSATLTNSLLSSPPQPPSSPTRGKERRNPSITPRKFRRFFTPRSRVPSNPSAARRALHDLGAPALNRCQTPSSPLKPISEEAGLDGLPSLTDARRKSKRRKTQHTPDRTQYQLPSPLNTSPVLLPTPGDRSGLRSPIGNLPGLQSSPLTRKIYDDISEDESDGEDEGSDRRPVPLAHRGMGAELVQRMTGGLGRASDRSLPCPVSGKKKTSLLNGHTIP